MEYGCCIFSNLFHISVVISDIFNNEGLEVLGWRSVPVDSSVVGYYAKVTMPNIQQVFVRVVKEENVDDIERELYICRKLIERAVNSEIWGNELYFCSLSNQTIVYKGMLRSEVLGRFYYDLQSELYTSPLAIYHRRFSTNTSPRWPLAQPMRFLGHNGEINTIQVNIGFTNIFCGLLATCIYLLFSHPQTYAGKLELDAIQRGLIEISCLA